MEKQNIWKAVPKKEFHKNAYVVTLVYKFKETSIETYRDIFNACVGELLDVKE